MTNDTVHSYTYDAEGNITKVDGGNTAQYVYDVFNRRIHVQTASATTEYIYDYAGRRVSSWVSPNNTGNEGRIYWDGQLVAHRSSEALTYFDHQDTLGTERIADQLRRLGCLYLLSLPWGDGYSATVNNAGGGPGQRALRRPGAGCGERHRARAIPQLCLGAGKMACP